MEPDDDLVERLRAENARLRLELARMAAYAPPPKPVPATDGRKRRVSHQREYLAPDVRELAEALDRWHRGTNSILLPAEALLAIVRGLGYRKDTSG